MDYLKYSSDDLIKDDNFQKWVLSPDDESDTFWRNLLQQHPHMHAPIQEARQFLLIFHFKEEDIFESRVANLKKRIDAEIDQPSSLSLTSSEQPDVPTSPARMRKWWWYAAASVLVMLTSVVLFQPQWFRSELEAVTPKGQRKFIRLDDGTQIWLNADSRLVYPKDFSDKTTREVQLQGEAFFDVAEDKTKPFIVHTSDLSVRVLGTAFNVKSYEQDHIIETTLLRGKVTIESPYEKNTLTLMPNQQAVFEKQTRKLFLEKREETAVEYTTWKEGHLVFNDQPLSMIVNELERWFNVTIKVEDQKSLDCHFSAKVDNKTLEEVLELFKASETIDYKIDGKTVFITGTLCDE